MSKPDQIDCVTLSLDEGIAWLTVNRAERRNALNDAARLKLIELVDWASRSAEVGLVVITGTGDEAFISGADLSEYSDTTVEELRESLVERRIYDAIEECQVPVIAMINGYCMGGGCELALCADIRIASDRATIGLPEIKLAMIPGGGGTQRLPRLVGRGRAMSMILTGDPVSAEEAFRIGLVDHLFPHGSLKARTREFCRRILRHSSQALKLAKQAVTAADRCDLQTGLAFERDLFCQAFTKDDRKEGFKARLEKRRPRFRRYGDGET